MDKIKNETKEIPVYIGDVEVYFPAFNKIVKKGDKLPELSVEQAKIRNDFKIIKEE